MKITMRTQLSGTRDGKPWPPPGETVDLPDSEAAKYCANGLAEPVATHKDTETAVKADTAEKRAPAKRTTRAKK